MEYRQLGKSGLTVSSIGLGTRTWGLDTDPHEAVEILNAFHQAGGNLVQVETDPRYPEPLEVLGELVSENSTRNAVVIGVRSGHFPVEQALGRPPQALSTGRGSLLDALDRTLKLLGTDHVDLWTVTGPLGPTPLDEMLSALEIAISSGRARYIGVGNLGWWNGGAAVAKAQLHGFPISAWEAPMSLLRTAYLSSEATELRKSGLGIVAGSPLAGGVLTGKYRHSTPPDSRATSPRFRAEIEYYLRANSTGSNSVVEAVMRAAEGLEHTAGQVSLAWVRSLAGVSSAIIGPRTLRQTTHLLESADWQLPRAITDVLTEVALGQ